MMIMTMTRRRIDCAKAAGAFVAGLAAVTLPARAADIDTPRAAAGYTARFHTFTGVSLSALLAAYGLRIDSIEVTPIESLRATSRKPGDRDGDVVATMHITGAVKPMPCGLHKWLAQGFEPGHADDAAEVVNRQGVWLASDPAVDPLLYWAATGKCSAAYGLPL
jgi:hypothetical protein